jgi:hypothetical protein
VTTAADGAFSFNQVLKGDYNLVATKDGFTVTTAVTLTDANISLEQAMVLYQILTVKGGAGSGHYAKDAAVTITADKPKAGARFTNWTAPDGVTLADAKAQETTFTMPGNAVEISANYESIPEIYTITYAPNGADVVGAMVADTFTEGVAQDLQTNAFTRDCYSFVGWKIEGDAAKTVYADKASFTAVADTTLYA